MNTLITCIFWVKQSNQSYHYYLTRLNNLDLVVQGAQLMNNSVLSLSVEDLTASDWVVFINK